MSTRFPFNIVVFLHSHLLYLSLICGRYKSRRDFKFDDIFHALLTLFEVLTLEGWLDVRDVFADSNRFNLVCIEIIC